MTSLEILDTAVKVGLGALITGLSAIWIARLNLRREQIKARASRRYDLMEQVAEDLQEFTHAALRFRACLANYLEAEKGPGHRVERLRKEFESARQDLYESFSLITRSESKLLLLGEEKCYAKVHTLGEEVRDRFSTPVEGREFTLDSLDEARTVIRSKRDECFRDLSKAYSRQG